MATALPEYKQFLEKCAVLLQLSNKVDIKEKQNAEGNLLFLSQHISLYTKNMEGRVLRLLLTLRATIFEGQLRAGEESSTFRVGNLTSEAFQPKHLTWNSDFRVQMERSNSSLTTTDYGP